MFVSEFHSVAWAVPRTQYETKGILKTHGDPSAPGSDVFYARNRQTRLCTSTMSEFIENDTFTGFSRFKDSSLHYDLTHLGDPAVTYVVP